MDQILEGLKGIVSIADNIVVFGEDEEDHDRNLVKLMERAVETGILFNSDKCTIKQRSVSFFGNMYTDKGIRPDPAGGGLNKDELHGFMGMITYLSPYISRFADKAHTLRRLQKSDAPWIWDIDHEKCFEDLKSTITEDTCLKY